MKSILFLLFFALFKVIYSQEIVDICNLSLSKFNNSIAIEGKDLECISKNSNSKFTIFFTFGSWCEPCILHLPNAINLSKIYDVDLYIILIDKEGSIRESNSIEFLNGMYNKDKILIIKDTENIKPRKKYLKFLKEITPEKFEIIDDMSKYILFNKYGEIIQITSWKDNRNNDWRDDSIMLKNKIIPFLESE